MRICFDLGPIFERQSSDVQNAFALRSMLDCLIRINVSYLKFAQKRVPRLYASGVRYGRTDVWDSIPALYDRKFGDCKSLTAALVAEYYMQGIESKPVFRFAISQQRVRNYHILVMVPKMSGYDKKLFEDPSRKLGMGADELKYFHA